MLACKPRQPRGLTEEFEAMARSSTAILMVGAPQQLPDIRYATGFAAPDPVIYLQTSRQKILVVPLLELERARREAVKVSVWAAETLPIRRSLKRSLAGLALGLLRQQQIRVVRVPPDFPLAIAQRLQRAGIRLQVATPPLFPQRQVKSARELLRIAECQRAAGRAMLAAVQYLALAQPDSRQVLRLGRRILTAELVRARINRVLLDQDCLGQGTIVAGGQQAADPHARGHGPLRAGESIVIDIFPQHLEHGYWGDLTRTVVRGRPTPALRRIYRAVKAAHAAALARVRAGVSAALVHQTAARTLLEHGFQNSFLDGQPQGFIHSTGHGVGLAIHEEPNLGSRPTPLQAGHVITVEPGLYYRELGSVRVEDLIVVTAAGWRPLAPCRYFFQI